ncbi:nitroreductase family protein [Nocardia wallacei]|uniref:nitroreductase family protein n=1 Tax=Nocardia wallacei TaxID=480035 RepID=UPI002453CF1A|nr:nitroreductase family protein [Nocardia wallacei]
MPLIEVTYGPSVPEPTLRELAERLPHLVSVAVECPEEPYDDDLRPGDVEIRFRALGPFDRSGLDAVIEVKSKWFASRAENRQERCELLHRSVEAATGLRKFGIYLSLPVAAWEQSDRPVGTVGRVGAVAETRRAPRSVRHFHPTAVARSEVERIIDVARWTGSARNRQPWRFVAVTETGVRRELARCGSFALHLADAPLVLVLLSHDNGFADTEFDMGRVAQSICLAADELGLGTCLTTFHPDDNVHRAARLVGAEPGWLPRHAVAAGYPAPAPNSAPTAIPRGRLPVAELLTWVS